MSTERLHSQANIGAADSIAGGDTPVSFVNPEAWTGQEAYAAGIGPAHPHHPYHMVYFGRDNQPLEADVVQANVRAAMEQYPVFPLLRALREVER